MRTPHSTFCRGKRIRLVLRDGTVIISKFVEKKGERMRLESGEYPMAEVRAANIYKPQKHERTL